MSFFKSVSKFLNKPAVKIGLGAAGAAAGFGAFEGVDPLFGSDSPWLSPEALVGLGNMASGGTGYLTGKNPAVNLAQMGLGGYNIAQGVGGAPTFQEGARRLFGGGTEQVAPGAAHAPGSTTVPASQVAPGAPHMPANTGYVRPVAPAVAPVQDARPTFSGYDGTLPASSRDNLPQYPFLPSGPPQNVPGGGPGTQTVPVTGTPATTVGGAPHTPSNTTVTRHGALQSAFGNPYDAVTHSGTDVVPAPRDLTGVRGSGSLTGGSGQDILGGGTGSDTLVTQAAAAAQAGTAPPVAQTPPAKPWFDALTDKIMSDPLNAMMAGSVLVGLFQTDPAEQAAAQYADEMARYERQSNPGSPQGQSYINAYAGQRSNQLDHEYEKTLSDFEVWATQRGMVDSSVYTDGMASINAQYADLRTRIPIEAQQAFLEYQNARFTGLANASTAAARGAGLVAGQTGPIDFSTAGTALGASMATG